MATNFYYQSGVPGGQTSEQRLVEDLIIESIKIYGFDLYYLPRTQVNVDQIFGDAPLAEFDNAIPVEAYLENVDGFGGDGELMSKFGIEIRDTATFVMARSRWEDVVGLGRSSLLQLPNRPSEGDLLYMPLTKAYFEIKKVDATNPFFQLGKLYVYKLQCELWQYSSEQLNTDVAEIDSLENQRSLNVGNFEFLLETGDRLILNNSQVNDPGFLLKEDWSMENMQANSDNFRFNTEALDGIIDFTEINPFGEVIKNNV
jgi:hypothetical protein